MTSSTGKTVARNALCILLAAVFIVSAVAKIFSIDQFELYVYSYGLFSLNITFILVRLCIGIELMLGVLLLTGWRRRMILLAMLAMLLFFCLFLCFAALRGRTDSCQCFGQLADTPPTLSLLKNAVLVIMTLAALRLQGKQSRKRTWLVAVLTAAALATPFIVSVPDSWMFGSSHERYNREALKDVECGDRETDRLVAFVTPGCPYCRMTRQKLDAMAVRHNITDEAIIYIEPKDIGDSLFLTVTYGARPLVLLMHGDSVMATYHYRNIYERQIVKALKK